MRSSGRERGAHHLRPVRSPMYAVTIAAPQPAQFVHSPGIGWASRLLKSSATRRSPVAARTHIPRIAQQQKEAPATRRYRGRVSDSRKSGGKADCQSPAIMHAPSRGDCESNHIDRLPSSLCDLYQTETMARATMTRWNRNPCDQPARGMLPDICASGCHVPNKIHASARQ